jgi:hypothetical protein
MQKKQPASNTENGTVIDHPSQYISRLESLNAITFKNKP